MLANLHPIPAQLNRRRVLAHRPATLSRDEICSVVLTYTDVGDEYVVWTYNRQNPGAHHGNYGLTRYEGVQEFGRRHGSVSTWVGDIRANNITITDAASPDDVAALQRLITEGQ